MDATLLNIMPETSYLQITLKWNSVTLITADPELLNKADKVIFPRAGQKPRPWSIDDIN